MNLFTSKHNHVSQCIFVKQTHIIEIIVCFFQNLEKSSNLHSTKLSRLKLILKMKEARKTTCKLNSWRSVNICFRGKIFNKEGGILF